MMTLARTKRSILLASAVGIAVVSSGCSDPRFKQEQDRRDARMTRLLTEYAAHDAAGVDRIRQTLDLDAKLNQHRAEHLTYTCGLVRARHERDVQRWKEEDPLRKARLEALFRGKPDEIDDTYAKMVY